MILLNANSPFVAVLGCILLGIIFAYAVSARARSYLAGSRKEFILRCLILGLLALVAAHPVMEIRQEHSSALALVDISDSMDAEATAASFQLVKKLQSEGVSVELLPFAGQAAMVNAPFSSSTSLPQLQGAWGKLNIGVTNLEAALAALFSRQSGSVLLISDGNENSGNSEKIRPAVQAAGFKIFPLVPERESHGNQGFRISNLYSPLVAAAMKSVDIRTSIQNSTDREQRGRVEISHDNKVLYTEPIVVAPHSETLLVTQSDPTSEGIREITARLTPDEQTIAKSSQTVYLSSEPREKVLLVSGAPEDERILKEFFQSQAYQLEAVVATSRGTSLPDLTKYSAVLFNNVAYEQLAKTSVNLLDGYVKGGGGFIMLGGNRSFGLGGYKDTPVEDILPVELLPPQTIKKRLNLAVQLVLDKSRSMSESDKIEYAKEAARASIRALKDDDYVGVIGFDAAPFVVVNIGQVGTTRDVALERVGRLFPAGRTNMLPAIDEARRSLMRVNAGRKHMVILTDGKIPDEGPYYIELVKQLRLLGITVSTVLLGSDADPGMLETMADAGGGAFYQTADPRNLPKIFITDLKVGSGEQTMREEEYLVRPGTSDKHSTSINAFPPIRGYVQTKSKKTADLELVAYDGNKAEPLLVSWKYGRGRSIAFTSDANGRWSSGWVPWPKFANFWNDLVDTVRQANDQANALRFDLRYSVERDSLVLDLSVFAERPLGAARAQLTLPNGETKDVSFSSISPGRYRTTIPNIAAGKYMLQAKVDDKKLAPVAFLLPGDLFGEQKGRGYDLQLLHSLADATGGKINPQAADIRSNIYTTTERTDLRFVFLVLSALLLLLEIFFREGLIARRQRVPGSKLS